MVAEQQKNWSAVFLLPTSPLLAASRNKVPEKHLSTVYVACVMYRTADPKGRNNHDLVYSQTWRATSTPALVCISSDTAST